MLAMHGIKHSGVSLCIVATLKIPCLQRIPYFLYILIILTFITSSFQRMVISRSHDHDMPGAFSTCHFVEGKCNTRSMKMTNLMDLDRDKFPEIIIK